MDKKNDLHSATTAAVERRNDGASAPTAGEDDVQGFGGLSGGVVGSVFGVPGLGIGAVGAARDGDFQIQGRKPGIGMGDSGT